MIDSVRLSDAIFLDDKLFDRSVWRRHQRERGTSSGNQPNTFQHEVHNIGDTSLKHHERKNNSDEQRKSTPDFS